MEEYIRVSGKTVEDAVLEASIQLGTTRDNIEYRVIEHETKGFLGIGAKKALIEARRKVTDEDIISEIFNEKKAEKPKKEKPLQREKKEEKKPEKKQVKAEAKEEKKQAKAEAKEEKKEEKKQVKAEVKEERKQARAEVREEKKQAKAEAAEEKKQAAAGADAEKTKEKPREEIVRVPMDPAVACERATGFLGSVFSAMGLDVSIDVSMKEDTLCVDLSGDDMGMLIGKRGQTLDSLQYLTSLVVNKGKASYVRVKLDTENYRERRKATLENLAKNIAFKVKKTRRPVYLEPMNPYERRIIHSALQGDPYVTTHSEGEEPCRKVVVTLKKREKSFDREEMNEEE